MRLSKHQTLLIIDRFEKSMLNDLFNKDNLVICESKIHYSKSNNGDIYSISYVEQSPSIIISVGISQFGNELVLELIGVGEIRGEYKLPFGVFKHFSKPYRAWRRVRSIVKKFDEAIKKTEKNKEQAKNIETFNHVLYTTYPNELDSIILGEKDDD